MNKTLRALKRGVAAAVHGASGPWEFVLSEKQVVCPHCGGVTFGQGSALLNTSGMTLLGLDWANKEATILICSRCGRIEWFTKAPERK